MRMNTDSTWTHEGRVVAKVEEASRGYYYGHICLNESSVFTKKYAEPEEAADAVFQILNLMGFVPDPDAKVYGVKID